MLSKDTVVGNQIVTVNNYNSAIKGVVDNWYKQNIDNNNLSIYLDDDAVFCNDRTIKNLGGWSKTGPTTGTSAGLDFIYTDAPTKSTATLKCANITDRFSKTNEKAKLTYPVGLLNSAEKALMHTGFARTGYSWWTATPSNGTLVKNISSSGGWSASSVYSTSGVRPAIVLKPGTELEEGGDGTYNNPYVVKTS